MAMLSGINADSSAMLSGVSDSGAGGGITTGNTWTNRGTGSDGDWQQVTEGGVYRYSTATKDGAVLGWVRPWVYDGTIVIDAIITGTVSPASETTAWTEVTSGVSSIASDSTKVTFTSIGSAGDTGHAKYDHGATVDNYYVTGLIQTSSELDGAFSGNGRAVRLETGARSISVTFSFDEPSSRYSAMVDISNVKVGQTLGVQADSNYLSEALLELYVIGNSVYVYFASQLQPYWVATIGDFPSTSGTRYLIGDLTSQGGGVTKVRESFFGRF